MSPYYEDETAVLYHGDALGVLRELPEASVDAVVTDPPYSSGGMVRGDRMASTHTKYVGSEQNRDGTGGGALAAFAGDNRDQRAYAYWSALWMGEALRVTRPGGVIVAFTDWRQLPSTADAIQAGGWVWRGIVPWVKPGARPQLGRFTQSAEFVVWGSSGPMPIEGGVLPGFYQAGAPREREHITQKPVDVMRSLVRICPEGGTVLDPFMGSGTTGVAAMLERRRFIGSEMIGDHAKTAERRIREAQGQAVPRGDQGAFDFGGAA